MKRAAFSKIERETRNSIQLVRQWNSHIEECQYDAPEELGKIYRELTGETRIKQFKLVLTSGVYRPILTSPDGQKLYIYCIDQVPYYGPDQEPYPVDDKSLWPWSAVNRPKPVFSKDIWECIIRRLPPKDKLLLALANKTLYEMAHHERFWQAEREAVYQPVALARPYLDLEPTWQFYSRLLHWCKSRKSNPCMNEVEDRLLLNLNCPFGDAYERPANLPIIGDDEIVEKVGIVIAGKIIYWDREKRKQKVRIWATDFRTNTPVHIACLLKPVRALLEGNFDLKANSIFVKWENMKELLLKK